MQLSTVHHALRRKKLRPKIGAPVIVAVHNVRHHAVRVGGNGGEHSGEVGGDGDVIGACMEAERAEELSRNSLYVFASACNARAGG